MAIDPSALYPGQVDTSDPTGYPNGAAKNETSPGDSDGTPLEAAWVSDMFGFLQALLDYNSATPSGVPDKVGASQYLDAVKKIAEKVYPNTVDGYFSGELKVIGASGSISLHSTNGLYMVGLDAYTNRQVNISGAAASLLADNGADITIESANSILTVRNGANFYHETDAGNFIVRNSGTKKFENSPITFGPGGFLLPKTVFFSDGTEHYFDVTGANGEHAHVVVTQDTTLPGLNGYQHLRDGDVAGQTFKFINRHPSDGTDILVESGDGIYVAAGRTATLMWDGSGWFRAGLINNE